MLNLDPYGHAKPPDFQTDKENVLKPENPSQKKVENVSLAALPNPTEQMTPTQNAPKAKPIVEDAQLAPLLGINGSEVVDPMLSQLKSILKSSVSEFEQVFARIEMDLAKEIQNLPEPAKLSAQKTLMELKELVQYAKILEKDKFKPEFVQRLVVYRIELRESGLTADLPEFLKLKQYSLSTGELIDKDGNVYDHIRNVEASIMTKFSAFCSERGGDFLLIKDWHKDQAKHSWSPKSCLVKQAILELRDIDRSKIWTNALPLSPDPLVNMNQLKTTLLMNMALTAEFLTHTDLPGMQKDKGTITIFRTEVPEVLEKMGIPEPKNDEDKQKEWMMKRGPAESGSILASVLSYGKAVTVQEVPFHRIVSTYITEAFLKDEEKEFICMFDDIPFKHKGICMIDDELTIKNLNKNLSGDIS